MKKNNFLKKFSAITLSILFLFSAAAVSASAVETTPAGYIKCEGNVNTELVEKYGDVLDYITQEMLKGENEIDISEYRMPFSDAYTTFRSLFYIHPELFFFRSFTYRGTYVDDFAYVTVFKAYFTASKEEILTQSAEFEAKANEYLSLIDDSMSDFQKAAILHDALVLNSSYSYDGSAYTLLVEGTGKCEDYSKVYMYLLAQTGIKTEYVISDSMNHGWCKVCIDGVYYHVDVTWDDPLPDKPGKVRHTYFLISDTAFPYDSDNGRYNHYDYTSATESGTDYDNALYHSYGSELCFVGSDIYAINNTAQTLVKYDYKTDTEEVVLNLDYTWSAGAYSTWVGNFSSLISHEGKLYYNSSDAVYTYDITDGTTEVFTENPLENPLYGLRAIDGKLYGVAAENPGVTGELQYICDLPEAALTLGDANGDGIININDATKIQRFKSELVSLTAAQEKAADFDGNGQVNIDDVTALQKYIAEVKE